MLRASIDSSSQRERAAKNWTSRKQVPAARSAPQRVQKAAHWARPSKSRALTEGSVRAPRRSTRARISSATSRSARRLIERIPARVVLLLVLLAYAALALTWKRPMSLAPATMVPDLGDPVHLA